MDLSVIRDTVKKLTNNKDSKFYILDNEQQIVYDSNEKMLGQKFNEFYSPRVLMVKEVSLLRISMDHETWLHIINQKI